MSSKPVPDFRPFTKEEWIAETARHILAKLERSEQVFSDQDHNVHKDALETIGSNLERARAESIDLQLRALPDLALELNSKADRAGANESLLRQLYDQIAGALATVEVIRSDMRVHRNHAKPDRYLAARAAVTLVHSVFIQPPGPAAVTKLVEEVLNCPDLSDAKISMPSKATIENWVRSLNTNA